MSKTTLLLFWAAWLLDVLVALLGYREFIGGVFGRYAAPSLKYIALWAALLLAAMLIIWGSLYFKNHDRPAAALIVAAIPLALALPYVLWLGVVMLSGSKTNWH